LRTKATMAFLGPERRLTTTKDRCFPSRPWTPQDSPSSARCGNGSVTELLAHDRTATAAVRSPSEAVRPVAKAPTGAESSPRLVTVAVPVWVKNDPDKPDDPVARRVRQGQPELVLPGPVS
jgi:hypothetical protein